MIDIDFPPLETAQPGVNCRRMEIVPSGRPDLSFRLTLPAGWANDPDPVSAPGDGSAWPALAVFAEKPGAEYSGATLPQWAIVSVLWRKVDFEVPIGEWTALELSAMQLEIQTLRLWNDAHGPAIDAGGTTVGVIDQLAAEPARVPVILRAIIRTNGSRAFAVWCMATHEAYPAARENFALAGSSFEFLQPVQAGIEPIELASAANPAFEVAHPASWMQRAVPTPAGVLGKSALDLLLIHEQNLLGLVRVKAVDLRLVQPSSIDSLMNDALEEMAEVGIAPRAPWTPNSDPLILSTPDLQAAVVSEGVVQDSRYELHFGVVHRQPLLFCVSALVAPIQADAGLYLRGHRAYAMALESLRAIA
jgi:hypothetical protein